MLNQSPDGLVLPEIRKKLQEHRVRETATDASMPTSSRFEPDDAKAAAIAARDFSVTHTVPAKFLVAYSKDGVPLPHVLCVFIRPAYELLFENVDSFWHGDFNSSKSITSCNLYGSSGIGKVCRDTVPVLTYCTCTVVA
jgi:hypothetical protein